MKPAKQKSKLLKSTRLKAEVKTIVIQGEKGKGLPTKFCFELYVYSIKF